MESTESFLCNKPLKPELAEEIWINIFNNSPKNRDDLLKEYTRYDEKKGEIKDDFNNAIFLLNTLNLLITSTQGLKTIDIPSDLETIFKKNIKTGYKLFLLRKLRDLSGNPGDYKLQAHFLLTYKILCNEKKGIQKIDRRIVNSINNEWKNENYIPRKENGDEYNLNEEKFQYWRDLAIYLGLIYPGSKRKEFVISISSELSISFFNYFINNSEDYRLSNRIRLHDFLTMLREKFLYFDIIKNPNYFSVNNVIEGLIINLELNKNVKFVKKGDSPLYILDNKRRENEIRDIVIKKTG